MSARVLLDRVAEVLHGHHRRATHEVKERRRERVHVRARVERSDAQLLGGHVLGRAHDDADLRDAGELQLRPIAGESKTLHASADNDTLPGRFLLALMACAGAGQADAP